MKQVTNNILQEKIIEKLESLNLDSRDFEFAKTKIFEITNEVILLTLDKNLEEKKEEIIKGHFLTNFVGLITSIKQQVEGIIDNDTKEIQTHNGVICENRKEAMEHELVVKAIKGFYREKLNGNFNEVKKLSQEELKIEKEKYQDTYSWALYSRQINFVLENIEDFFIYLFENNFFKNLKNKHLFEEGKLIFKILFDIKNTRQNYKNYKNELENNKDLNHIIPLIEKNILDKFYKISFFKTINLKDFFELFSWKFFFDTEYYHYQYEFLQIINLQELFEIINIQEFFKVINLKKFLNTIKIKIDVIGDKNDLTINFKDKKHGYYKTLYIGKNGLYAEYYNSTEKFNINFEGQKLEIQEFPQNEQLILIYDKDNGGFTDIYK